jgi:hypothetical protein
LRNQSRAVQFHREKAGSVKSKHFLYLAFLKTHQFMLHKLILTLLVVISSAALFSQEKENGLDQLKTLEFSGISENIF